MTALQKSAWFNLSIVTLSLVIVAGLYPFVGWAAHAGLGLCGLLGFDPIFYRKRGTEVISDEREIMIQKRSTLIGYSVFWVVFVLTASLFSPFIYGQEGSVPVIVVQLSVFYAVVLFVGVMSISILIQNIKG
ncbi:hypothetical protein OAF42_00500 [Planctomicrobium sp.]|jgi:hypothetical protein|nr:hypothetical protein [Planctomicrobium sp.]MBT5019317.1 hypothetical protein [Planctomicrobium sp.]MDA7528104.1 hypothetical protein [bacterium]MDB4732898.1 hypothetical protein [Planctomicrobium sp.]